MNIVIDNDGNVKGYMTTYETAKVWGVPPGTVRQLINRGKVPDSIRIGNQKFIKEGTPYPVSRK